MLLACYSHKHISYRIRTIIRKAITMSWINWKINFVYFYNTLRSNITLSVKSITIG
ncbi:hypothetical protein [Wolbachia endosymbiont (group A) of Nomada hirtipes]|uniref:hypothetical protein n=1 Tax=Wolbachia endosymbiont (group A) of Nomada hirtipes TaxID=3066208 RepID=UPI0030CD4F03